MAKKKSPKLQRKKDTSFGSVYFDRTNLPTPATASTGFVLNLSLEEGLRLQLSLHQALWELNRLDRRSPASRQKGVALTMYPQQNRITVNMGTLKESSPPNPKVKTKKKRSKAKEPDKDKP